ncbi:MAG: HPr-rel-A system PqqD family peptide chaperone [Hydrogenophilales bacterium]|jgi:PqqD family protein of HPr-rel-A system|nr:HPr-rel-A system PqqD family peptide chaperone [Hydrogenophilales bacterium]
MTAAPSRTWRVPPEADLRHRAWDGEDVFFHGGAGDTHRLSAAAAIILLRLSRAPADEATLADELARAAACDTDEAGDALAGILDELARLEYAEPAP